MVRATLVFDGQQQNGPVFDGVRFDMGGWWEFKLAT
jgi:hypothetical protein